MDFFSPSLVKKYKDILKSTPGSTAFCPLAQVYRMRKDLKKAEKLCLHGLKHNPRHLGGHIALAQTHRDQGNWKEALKYLNKAKNIDPDSPKVYGLMGEIYRDRKDLESSLKAFKMVLFLKPWSKFAEQMVQQLEGAVHSETPEPFHSPSLDTKNNPNLLRLSREQRIKKLQKLLSHIEKIISLRENNQLTR